MDLHDDVDVDDDGWMDGKTGRIHPIRFKHEKEKITIEQQPSSCPQKSIPITHFA